LDLPIDHFRLLGAGPATDAEGVLRMLQQRLDRVPDQGFTLETLQIRAELLRASADLLSDGARRAAYESDLTALVGQVDNVMAALEIPSSKEVAGLLLLLEAGQPIDSFERACRCLQPPQAPTLGSSREADLTLLAGLAALAAAEEFQQQRLYEAAAGILQQGLQLLQRMGQLPEQRERLQRRLDQLVPYRVLDLLHRDLGASSERQEGLVLLEQLVQRRGGLEGNEDPDFPAEEFQAFFKQIRGYLTVQEQVDLFSRWGDGGSEVADYLASLALTASGFAQRKPERIAEARQRLENGRRTGIEALLANLHLLLGEVDLAHACFERGASKELRSWVSRESSDSLGQLCAYCRDWLGRDVLPGYRDLDADPDLEAYFSDRDVVAYVEREDRRSGRNYAPPPPTPSKAPQASGGGSNPFETDFNSGAFGSGSFGAGSFGAGGFGENDDKLPPYPPAATEDDGDDEDDGEAGLGWPWLRLPPMPSLPSLPSLPTLPSLGRPRLPSLPSLPGLDGLRKPAPWLLAAAAGAVAIGAVALLRPRPPQTARPAVVPLRVEPARPAPATPATQAPSAAPAATGLPLRVKAPDSPQLQALLEAWLAAKATVLAGGTHPAGLDELARPGPIERLERERREDAARGESQTLDVKVRQLAISERTPARIAVTAELAYSDRRLDRAGHELARTAPTSLRNVYVFGRDGDTWRLAATTPAN